MPIGIIAEQIYKILHKNIDENFLTNNIRNIRILTTVFETL